MRSKLQIAQRILSVEKDASRDLLVREVREHQLQYNAIYREFVQRINQNRLAATCEHTFLPIELFKYYRVSCEDSEELIFKSSGTTSSSRSKHFVFDRNLYERASQSHFESHYGDLKDLTIYALLPSYLEVGDSSLVYMVNNFIENAGKNSGFLLNEPQALYERLDDSNSKGPIVLFGVSYALLDFAERFQVKNPNLTIIETGGMKGRRKELTRPELHRAVKEGFPQSLIHSEYGMTELLSQAYSKDGEWFSPPNWLIPFATEVSDPLRILPPYQRGLLAFIDLANYHGCSFIQTKDIGLVNDKGQFTVEGRLDNSDLRGCNLLYV